jgi:hypothetical protein
MNVTESNNAYPHQTSTFRTNLQRFQTTELILADTRGGPTTKTQSQPLVRLAFFCVDPRVYGGFLRISADSENKYRSWFQDIFSLSRLFFSPTALF